jgi:crotonobetainyl-CoA:carnitine CoA-transferase CaiB-like acyl-CoA transferase
MAPFPAGDGKTVMLGLQNEREWKSFCAQVLLQATLADDDGLPATPNAVPTAMRCAPSSSTPLAS